jgi:aminopeptidase N
MTEQKTIRLSDYKPYTHVVDSVDLTFGLAPNATRVTARIALRPNPERPGRHDLRLDGEGLILIACTLDGKPVSPQIDDRALTLAAKDLPDGPFTLQTEVEIAPKANTALEGLYMSKGMYCTQC